MVNPLRKPTFSEVKEFMDAHNADEIATIEGEWDMATARYHLELSDEFYVPEVYVEPLS